VSEVHSPFARTSRATGGRQGTGYSAEGGVGVAADGRNGDQANHDDEGQHHGVLDRRRTVFSLHEFHYMSCQGAEHGPSPFGDNITLDKNMKPWIRARTSARFKTVGSRVDTGASR